MRVAMAIVIAAACGSEPILIGKLCSAERPCPNGLYCAPDGTCVAELEGTETLSLITDGPGSGVVTSAPAGLRCERSCDVEFPAGATVTLTAHPIAGSGFAGWKGACTGRAACVVSMSDARSVTAVFGVEVDHPWVVRYGGAADDRVVGLSVDPSGSPIVAGHFASTVQFGSKRAMSSGGSDGFVAKLSPSAEVVWVSTFGGAQDDVALSVTPSIDGAILATGWYFGPAEIFGESRAGIGSADPLLARIDPTGARELAIDLGSSAIDVSERAVFDDDGGAWVAGWATGPLTAGGITRGHVGGSDAYLVHALADGTADVVQVFGGTGDDKAFSIDRSASGDRIALVGVFQGSIAFGGTPITSSATRALYAAVFDANGEPLWAKAFPGGGPNEPFGAGCFDLEGNLLLAGGFHEAIDFGDRARTSAGDLDAFVAKLSPEGDLLWAHTFGGPTADAFFDLRVDDLGQVVLGGGFTATAEFGAEALTSAGSWDAILVKLDAGGEHVWSRRFGGSELDVILGVGLDVAGTVVAGGHFGGTVDFGTMLLTSAGSQDAFLVAVGR